MNLTKNFTLEEFVFSENAIRNGIDNTPSENVIRALVATAQLVEEVRLILAAPILITSGYRSPEVNALTKGSSPTSAHTRGEAADCKSPAYGNPYTCCLAIRNSNIWFDQLILEYDSWFHISWVTGGVNRKQILTKRVGTNYMPGLVSR